jgi:hypothetical protein
MKKILFSVGLIVVFGFTTTNFSAQANTIEPEKSKISIESNAIEQEIGSNDVVDPIVTQDGPEDGINDQTSVNIKIRS